MKKIILALLAVFLIVGAAWFLLWNGMERFKAVDIAKKNNANIAKVKIAMPKETALKIMGRPEKTEVFSNGGQIIEFLFYRTKGFNFLPLDSQENFTPIAIDYASGIVINWDLRYYKEKAAPRQ